MDRSADRCRRLIESSRSEGLYTPPTAQGTLLVPFTGGGPNWGGAAFDPASQTLYVNSSRAAHRITLMPAADRAAADAASGAELWAGRLPAGGQATPMTYVWNRRQYVVIAAGGHSTAGTRPGDSLVAFALPD